jgi:large subunit ribosomal protein L20
VTAACEERGYRYSALMGGLKKAGIELNRKMLSEIAIADPKMFDRLVETAQNAA